MAKTGDRSADITFTADPATSYTLAMTMDISSVMPFIPIMHETALLDVDTTIFNGLLVLSLPPTLP
ncbi:hypothetical protein ACW189_05155 [Limosilactobacillus fermentum]